MPKLVCFRRWQLLNWQRRLARSALSALTLHSVNVLLLLVAFGQFKLYVVAMEATFQILQNLHARAKAHRTAAGVAYFSAFGCAFATFNIIDVVNLDIHIWYRFLSLFLGFTGLLNEIAS